MIRFFVLLFSLLLCCSPSLAQEKSIEKIFQSLPVLHEGRVKPLDSFSRIYLKTFSGQENIEKYSSINWLLTTIFFPEEAIYIPVFEIKNYDLFSLKESDGNLYDYETLSNVLADNKKPLEVLLNKSEENFTPREKELINLYQNHILYTQLLRSMTLFLPLAPEEKSVYQGGEDKRFFDIITEGGKENVLLRIVSSDQQYTTPWQGYFLNAGKYQESLGYWQEFTVSYRAGDMLHAANILDALKPVNTDLSLEVLYNKLSLLRVALIAFLASLSFVAISYYKSNKVISFLSLSTLILGGVSLATHIVFRSLILERPPVGTLYESVIFVAFIVVLFAIAFAMKHQKIAVSIGAVVASGLLIVSSFFDAPETLGTLDAVLNTNFWLATHVVCITIGYGACLFVSALAHIMFFQKRFQKPLQIGLIVSLFFTVIGTVLGGIWADQSWGRFWGWDPKENGAMLIVLWLIWLLHGRMSGHLKGNVYLACCGLLSIIVVLAWFGVNLLNVGLHSYGFISGVAWGISLFCLFEILCIGLFFYLSSKRELRHET